MREFEFSQKQSFDLPIDKVSAFFADPVNLTRITPDRLDFEMVTETPPDVREGTLIDYKLRDGGKVPLSFERAMS